jgi:hypothetical protein
MRIPSLTFMTYADRIAMLNLETLELGRLHFDLIFYYKLLTILPLSILKLYSSQACGATVQSQKATKAIVGIIIDLITINRYPD